MKKCADKRERGNDSSILDNIPALSPILKAVELKNRVAKVGFDWEDAKGVLLKLDEEVEEVKEAIEKDDRENIEEEIGDALFVLINLADKLGIDPEIALKKANEKFERRFRGVEEKMREADIRLERCNLEKMEAFWQEVKSKE